MEPRAWVCNPGRTTKQTKVQHTQPWGTIMRARCRREGLLAACQLASAALPAREVKPILRNLKAVAADGRCTLMATDLEVGIRLDVQGLVIEEPGEAILPAARLVAILREATDE